MAKVTKKFTLALDEDVLPWLNYESGRRDMSVTKFLNTLVRESQANAPEEVAENFKGYMATREN